MHAPSFQSIANTKSFPFNFILKIMDEVRYRHNVLYLIVSEIFWFKKMSEVCLSFIYLHTCQVLGYLPHRIISTSTPTITTTLFTSQQNLLTDNWFNQPRPSSQFTGNKLNTTNISHAMWEMKKNYHKHMEFSIFKTFCLVSSTHSFFRFIFCNF